MIEYIGVDLGGTNIRVGGIDENENLIYEYKEPTFKDVITGDELYEKIVKLIKKVPGCEDIKGIGIGIAGSVNQNTMRMISSRNVSCLIDYPIVEKLSKEFEKNVFFENDAKVTALAEAIVRKR